MANKKKTRRDALGFGAAVVAFGVATGIDIVGANAASVSGAGHSTVTVPAGSAGAAFLRTSVEGGTGSMGGGQEQVTAGGGGLLFGQQQQHQTSTITGGTGPTTIQASPSRVIGSSVRGAPDNTARTNGGSNTIGGTSAGSGNVNRR
jgi:hypothetical protein